MECARYISTGFGLALSFGERSHPISGCLRVNVRPVTGDFLKCLVFSFGGLTWLEKRYCIFKTPRLNCPYSLGQRGYEQVLMLVEQRLQFHPFPTFQRPTPLPTIDIDNRKISSRLIQSKLRAGSTLDT